MGDVAELLERCASFAERGRRADLAAELNRHAQSVRDDDGDAIARADAMFISDGPLHLAAVRDGWDEEYVGLVAAYGVETAPLR